MAGFTRIGTTDSSATTYVDTTASTDVTYYYYVRAYSDSKESASSNTIRIKTQSGAVGETIKRSLIANYLEEEDSGFNWLNFCLLSCGGILLLALIVYEVWRWRKTGSFINHHKVSLASPSQSAPPIPPEKSVK